MFSGVLVLEHLFEIHVVSSEFEIIRSMNVYSLTVQTGHWE